MAHQTVTDHDAQALVEDLPAFRRAVASFLATDDALDRWRGAHYPTEEETLAEHAELVGVLYRAGWNRFGWPREAGGLGGDERHRAIVYDELSAHNIPVPEQNSLLETLGPPLVRFAPALAAEVLPAFLRGEEWWGQGFSEPDAGSDLASLRCRAERDGDEYVVNGQKVWTSHGAAARRLVCLVRTGTPESRHRGLSMIMIDADSPGITRRPLTLASGRRELAEEFFDNVRVPASRLIGAEGQGWAVAMYLLQFERAMYAWQVSTALLRRVGELRDRLAAGRVPDGAARRLALCYADVIALRARSAETVRRLARGETVGPEASVDKILLATAEQGLYDAGRDLLAPWFAFDAAGEAEEWRSHWWYSRAASIMGGSAEVQRGILADHVLGLPKESA